MSDIPSEYPWYMHHPTQPLVLTQTVEEAQALVDADPLWRMWPYAEEEKPAPGHDPGAALAAPQGAVDPVPQSPPDEASPPAPPRRRS